MSHFLSLTSSNPRHRKALELLQTSAEWGNASDANGTAFFGIPAKLNSAHLYITNSTSCTCPDSTQMHHKCKHQIAVKLYEIMKGKI